MTAYSHSANSAPIIMFCSAIILAVASLVAFALFTNDDIGFGCFSMAIGAIILSIVAMRYSVISKPLTVAFLLRFGICILYTIQGDGDADGYGLYAEEYASIPIENIFDEIPLGAYLYSWIISFLFRVFGENYMPVRAMNTTLSVWSVMIFFDIVAYVYRNRNISMKAVWIFALFPNLVRFSSYFANREVVLLVFVLLYIKYSCFYYNTGNNRYLILSILILVPAMILHTSMIAMMMLTMLIILTRKSTPQYKGISVIGKGLLASITLIAFVVMIQNGVGMEKVGLTGEEGVNANSISAVGNMAAEGRAAYLQGVNFSNPVLIILFLPVRMLYFLFTPFPWMVRNGLDVIGLFDALLYIWASIPLWKKIKEIRHKGKSRSADERFMLLLFLALVVIVAMFASATSNYGTAIRHRCKLFPIFLLIAIDYIKIPFYHKNRYISK